MVTGTVRQGCKSRGGAKSRTGRCTLCCWNNSIDELGLAYSRKRISEGGRNQSTVHGSNVLLESGAGQIRPCPSGRFKKCEIRSVESGKPIFPRRSIHGSG